MKFKLQFFGLLMFALMGTTLYGQLQSPLDIALRNLETDYKKWDLKPTDISDVVVSNKTTSAQNGMTNIYFIQRYHGIEIYNAILNYTISNKGKIAYVGNRFVSEIGAKANSDKPTLTPEQAIMAAAQILGAGMIETPRLITKSDNNSFVFQKSELSRSNIPVKLRYQLAKDGSLKLAWDLAVDYKGSNDYWSMRIDAKTGELLDKNNFTVHCQHEAGKYDASHDNCEHTSLSFPENMSIEKAVAKTNITMADNQYKVFPFPLENPKQGSIQLVTNPADPNGSPFGWHDTNGIAGAESNITTGNNVHAFQDRDANYASNNDEPDGGANLIFDFPYDVNLEPDTYTKSAVVQLFYNINFMHDFTFNFGFDEFYNFQVKNYSGIGLGDDQVNALSQFDANTLTNINNADFSTPSDGNNSRVRMFLWDNSLSASKSLKVTAPFPAIGAYDSQKAEFGDSLSYYKPVSGKVILANDGSPENPSFACAPLSKGNGAEMVGKIVLIDRGSCEFGAKAKNAQDNGAIAVIICNFEEATIGMAAGLEGANVNVPVISVKKSTCDKMKLYESSGELTATIQGPPPTSSGPLLLDGSFDNGIMAHEFGHGVSNRLTGGPDNTGCLGNGEQMGEGWSDFLALATTVKPWDTKDKVRGVGTYVTKEDSLGKGIRTFPYSIDMNINPHTYGDVVSNEEVHYVGEVWATMLWDLYWAMVDKYGLDATYKNINSGSYKAVQLVMDGMKIQPCSPGFQDGRDAILAADVIDNNGENACLIWSVFARRGLGFNAQQNSSDITGDAKEDFNTKPICLNKMQISKEVTPLIKAGENMVVKITVSNYKSITATGVKLTDQIPANTIVSDAGTGVVNGDVISFDLGDMATEESKILTYTISTPLNYWSQRQLYDDCEQVDNWDVEAIEGGDGWNSETVTANSGVTSFGIQDVAAVNKHNLKFMKPFTVTGDRPVLRFYQQYDTQAGVDGGYIEISENGGSTWSGVNGKFLRNGYPAKLQYATFVLPNLEAFSGNSNGWISSYIDLSDYVGKDIVVRFKYGSNDKIGGNGWFIDDLEYMDLKTYNGQACVTNNEGDTECAIAPEEGTIVESQLTAVNDLKQGELSVFPNPAKNYLNISLNTGASGKYDVNIMSVDGRLIKSDVINLSAGSNNQTLDVQGIPSGCYLIRIQNAKEYFINKIILKD